MKSSQSPAKLPEGFDPPSDVGIKSQFGETYTPPAVNGWAGYLVGFAVLVIVAVMGYMWWDKQRSNEDDLEQITLRAIRDIYTSHMGRCSHRILRPDERLSEPAA